MIKYQYIIIYSLLSCYPMLAGLDPDFGTNGVTITVVGRSSLIAASALQTDEKIVVAGPTTANNKRKIALARYTTAGVLDTTFNTTGVQKTLIGSASEANAITLQTDGKILVGGFAIGSETDFLIARYTTNGDLDSTFNSIGFNTTQIGSGATINSIKVQSNGKIVAAGTTVAGSPKFALAQYNSDGTLDTGFGTSGIVTTPIGFMATINQIALQSDEKIVAIGRVFDGAMNKIALARYNTNGTLDTAFGSSGIVTTNIASESDPKSVAIQTDGKIVVTGYAIESGMRKFVVARYTSTGTLDTSFNFPNGFIITEIQNSAEAHAIAIQTDNKIVVAGYSMGDKALQFVIVRYTSAGTIDTTFGTNGIEITTVGAINSDARIHTALLQSDGKIVVAGESDEDFAIARYEA